MQANYLNQLSPAVRAFVEEVETGAGLAIEVVPHDDLNDGGPTGQGKLSIDIESQSIRLNAPTNGYFPDGAVRHEVLHVQRLHLEHVPRLAVADDAAWDAVPQGSLTHVDNALEHLVIVPVELQHHPERRDHWERVMKEAWETKLPQAPTALDRRIYGCLHWAFLSHVMPGSPVFKTAAAFLQANNIRDEADAFVDQLVPRLEDKVEVVRLFFDRFPELPRGQVALEYLSALYGTTQQPIPG